MGLSASQGRLLLLTAKRSDLEFRAQQISQKRLILSQQLEEISLEYENATSNRQMSIMLYQTQSNNQSDQSYRSANLTYASLISGTVSTGGPGTNLSGIQASGAVGTDYYDFSSSTAYRLVSTSGAIVVSDASEIPGYNEDGVGEYKYNRTSSKAAEQVTTGADGSKKIFGGNLYKTTHADSQEASYSILDAGGKLKSVLGITQEPVSIKFDRENGLIQYINDEGKSIYAKFDGEKYTKIDSTDDYESTHWEDATLYGDKASIPQSTFKEEVTGTVEIQEGADGVITVIRTDANGNSDGGTRYIIDEALRYGSTDSAGTIAGPNYLQDCLRNGKYLVQKGSVDKNNDEGFKWSNISWDATVNISDAYYTADDDAAKAKYDRLQNQIQAQDKKLELELDNIETQRSAVTTEIESVEKVINENIESTFNAFG